MVYFTYIAAGVILLGFCIFIHEFGHLLGGKMVGIKAKTFSIGMGKGIIKKKIGDTTYQLAPIPFGGYCQFYGEDPAEQRSGAAYEFLSAHPLRRIVTVMMGPLFNLLFGIVIFFVMNLVGYTKDTNRINIPENMRAGRFASASYAAGLRSGDRIVKINGHEIQSFSDIQENVFFSEGRRLDITARRDGRIAHVPVTPKRNQSGRYEIGVLPYGSKIYVVELVKGEAAEAAGLREKDEILSLGGVVVNTEYEFTDYIQRHADKPILFKIMRDGAIIEKTITPRLTDIIKFQTADRREGAGGTIPILKSKMLQGLLEKGLLRINGKRMPTYEELVRSVEENKNKQITFQFEDEKYTGYARLEKAGFIGVMPSIMPDQIQVRYGFGGALVRSFTEPYSFIVMNLKGLGMLFSGKMNVRENLSGPIRIVKIAGDVAYYKGIPDFIILMAKISIILMVMNLLPIPVVDGSHIVFFLIEIVRGKPMSQKVMERIQTVGIVILVMLGAFVIINDISMLPLFQRFLK
ncbi:MAG: RIP metalloprotease RseP [Spirochaetes bacterium RBG_16_49_21]|nr:MAG: RIP metalloprotease RseP [Spirochaetes bacterium RBG_16_49_21]